MNYRNFLFYKMYKEIKVFIDFKKTIKALEQSPDQNFWNRYNYTRNIFYTKIGCDLLLPDYATTGGDISKVAFKEFVDKHYLFFEQDLMFGEVLKRAEPLVYYNDEGVRTSIVFISLDYKFKYFNLKNIFRALLLLLIVILNIYFYVY